MIFFHLVIKKCRKYLLYIKATEMQNVTFFKRLFFNSTLEVGHSAVLRFCRVFSLYSFFYEMKNSE
ncbi:MAG: hypothetical protein DWQ02_03135 [Bacteroidetes bacterium]|nr:MAG: hypothetical protein DWQ02_03135 [Bacteroidota bacterium]